MENDSQRQAISVYYTSTTALNQLLHIILIAHPIQLGYKGINQNIYIIQQHKITRNHFETSIRMHNQKNIIRKQHIVKKFINYQMTQSPHTNVFYLQTPILHSRLLDYPLLLLKQTQNLSGKTFIKTAESLIIDSTMYKSKISFYIFSQEQIFQQNLNNLRDKVKGNNGIIGVFVYKQQSQQTNTKQNYVQLRKRQVISKVLGKQFKMFYYSVHSSLQHIVECFDILAEEAEFLHQKQVEQRKSKQNKVSQLTQKIHEQVQRIRNKIQGSYIFRFNWQVQFSEFIWRQIEVDIGINQTYFSPYRQVVIGALSLTLSYIYEQLIYVAGIVMVFLVGSYCIRLKQWRNNALIQLKNAQQKVISIINS